MHGLRPNGGQNTFHIGPHAQDAGSEEGSEIRLGVGLADWLLRVSLRISNMMDDSLHRKCKRRSVSPSPVRRGYEDVNTILSLNSFDSNVVITVTAGDLEAFATWNFLKVAQVLPVSTVVREGLLA